MEYNLLKKLKILMQKASTKNVKQQTRIKSRREIK